MNLVTKNSVNQCKSVSKRQKRSTFVESPLQIHPFYAKQTQTSSFSAQKSRFRQKTKPKQTQTKPNGYLPKMNASPLLTRYYEKLRLSGRNENKPNSNPNFWAYSITENVFSVNSACPTKPWRRRMNSVA